MEMNKSCGPLSPSFGTSPLGTTDWVTRKDNLTVLDLFAVLFSFGWTK